MARQRIPFALIIASSLALGACGGESDTSATTPAPPPASEAPSTASATSAAAPDPAAFFDDQRCAANKAAGTITYLTSFDFAATASIVEVLVAKERGYFDELCLTVEIKPSFSTVNYPLVAANEAQFSSGGSFSEVAQFAAQNEAEFVVVVQDGKTGIDALIVKADGPTTLAAMKGETIGVKGKITPSVRAMLAKAGLTLDKDYTTVDVQQQYGFDPKAHIAIEGIIGFPGFKSNEPGQLERAKIPFQLFDPADDAIPGSFGIIYTNQAFIDEHPTAAQDFVRAAMRGLADSIADPQASAEIAVAMIDANGNPNFLSPEGEVFRWKTEADLVRATTAAGQPFGMPDTVGLAAEVKAYGEVGIFDGPAPSLDGLINTEIISGVYDSTGTVIWPAA